jgi:hypothetical protein
MDRKDLLILALIQTIAFLLAELFFRANDLYLHAPWIDNISHLLAGIAIFSLSYWSVYRLKKESRRTLAVFISLLAAIAWELLEMIEEMIIQNPPHLVDIFVWDGFTDIVVTLSGAAICALAYRRLRL